MALKAEQQQLIVKLGLEQFDAGASNEEAVDFICTCISRDLQLGEPAPAMEDIRSSIAYLRIHYDKTRKPQAANREALGGALYDYLVNAGWKPPA